MLHEYSSEYKILRLFKYGLLLLIGFPFQQRETRRRDCTTRPSGDSRTFLAGDREKTFHQFLNIVEFFVILQYFQLVDNLRKIYDDEDCFLYDVVLCRFVIVKFIQC